MRSGVPGNLSAEGPAPRLGSDGKQEEDAGETRAGRMRRRDRERERAFLKTTLWSSETIAVFTSIYLRAER